MSNNFDGKRKIERALSKRTETAMEIRIIFKDGKSCVFVYYKRNRFLDLWELGRPHDTRLSHKRLSVDDVLSSVLSYVAENLSEIAEITVEGKT